VRLKELSLILIGDCLYRRILSDQEKFFTFFVTLSHCMPPNRFVEDSKAELHSRLANPDQALWTPLPIPASSSLGAVAGMMAALVYLDPDMMSTAFRKITRMIRRWSPSKLRSTSG
jgi:hypothetical protein